MTVNWICGSTNICVYSGFRDSLLSSCLANWNESGLGLCCTVMDVRSLSIDLIIDGSGSGGRSARMLTKEA